MKQHPTEKQRSAFFTFVEITGFIAIVTLLVVAIAPQVAKTIDKSRVTDLFALVKTLQGSSAAYYSDLGSMLPMDTHNSTGVMYEDDGFSSSASLSATFMHQKNDDQQYGKWNRFNGSYLDTFDPNSPPLGHTMRLSSMSAQRIGGVSSSLGEQNFSLDGDEINDIDSGAVVVALIIDGVTLRQWELVEEGYSSESSMDGDESERQARGRVKYSPQVANGRLIIYIVHN